MKRTARIDPTGRYRYELTREWDDTRERVAWIMLNPSTADAEIDDPTIRRCIGFSRAWGYGSLVVVNLFALRATDPRELKAYPASACGPENDEAIRAACTPAAAILCAWGVHGALWGRGAHVLALLRLLAPRVYHLGRTKDGHPKHPLYLHAEITPTPWGDR